MFLCVFKKRFHVFLVNKTIWISLRFWIPFCVINSRV